MDQQTTNLVIFRPTPAHAVLRERAHECITKLSASNGIGFKLAYTMAVGAPCAQTKHPDNLTPPEEEALLDLGLVLQAWGATGDCRPPQDHIEFLEALRRIGGRPSFMSGRLTRQGKKIVERYDAAHTGRPVRYQ